MHALQASPTIRRPQQIGVRAAWQALALATTLLAGVPHTAAAQVIAHDPAAAPAGTYQADPDHTQVLFAVNHFGFSTYYGLFGGATGTLRYDASHPETLSLEISVPVASVVTTSARLTEMLKGPEWLDAAHNPAMIFRSTSVRRTAPNQADVTGNLTLHGVTRPLTLHATFNGSGTNPLTHKQTVGFQIAGELSRSDYGVNRYVPFVSDVIRLTIAAAFER